MGNCCGSQEDGYDDMDQPSVVGRRVMLWFVGNYDFYLQEARRQAAAEAAEKRVQNQATRGIQDPAKVQRMQQRSEEIERLEREAAMSGDAPALRVSVFLSRDDIHHIGVPWLSHIDPFSLFVSVANQLECPCGVWEVLDGDIYIFLIALRCCLTTKLSVCVIHILNKIKSRIGIFCGLFFGFFRLA